MLRLILYVLGGLFVFCQVSAQNITVKSVSLQPTDKTAIEQLCLDKNGDTCALVKIKTPNLEGIQFSNPNQYIKVSYTGGIYSVYVPAISRKLDFLHKDYMPVQLDLADYGYRRLKKGKTYLVVLDAPKISDLKSSVVIKVEPKNAAVLFDGKQYEANSNGTIEIPVAEGKYTYAVSAANFRSQNGTFTIGKSEAKTITAKLQPILHEVIVGSNIEKARVFVDNMDYGNVGKLFIPQGLHKIRVQADGYVDLEKEVDVSAATGSLPFVLKENKKVTHIHATPVTIHSKSTNIYKNNKKIKEWTNGATIMFMPGKYMLSDDEGKTKKIEVKDLPMDVSL